MSSENLDIELDEILLAGTGKRSLDHVTGLDNESNKRSRIDEDLFSDLPPLDISDSASASPNRSMANDANSAAQKSPKKENSLVDLKNLTASTPSTSANPAVVAGVSTKPSVAAASKKVAKSNAKKESTQPGSSNPASTAATKEESNDPDKLSDALLAAGIDLKAEETLLAIANQNKFNTSTSQSGMTPAKIYDLKQFGGFMNKVIKENAINQLSPARTDMVELVQLACDQFITDVVTNSVIYSRHRRRPLRSKAKSSSTPRSEVSRALKELAMKDKEAEEKRMKKRAALGMDNGDDKVEKAGAEETLHRAANATAAMMMAGSKKKKYSWMTGSSNGNSTGGSSQASGSTNSAIAARGDTGIRYREAREEPGIVLRDLVAALETKRTGVDRTLTKAYSRL